MNYSKSTHPGKNSDLTVAVLLIFIAAVTFYVLSPSLQNDFNNWDDPHNVTENLYIRALSLENITAIFTTETLGSYHPLAILSYAVDYKIAGLEPFQYHLTNLILHVLNTVLVFWLIFVLSGSAVTAFAVSLMFGIHPMHVESVAWVTERRDLLYTFAYLCSLICYTAYIKNNLRTKHYFFMLGFFILALFSKSASVTLPCVLVLLDYYFGRPFDKKAVIEKVPLFLLSILFGLIVVNLVDATQAKKVGAELYTVFDRVLLANYTFVMYIVKLIYPYMLSAIYPFPDKAGNFLPVKFFIAPLIAAAMAALVFKNARRHREYAFGFLFYFFNIALVSQIFITGQNFMADRYSYLSSIGIFFVIASLVKMLAEQRERAARFLVPLLSAVFVLYAAQMSVLSFQRCKVWKDSFTLWTDAIGHYPLLGKLYGQRAHALKLMNQFDLALVEINKQLEIEPDNVDALNLRSVLYRNIGQFDLAIGDLNRAVSLAPHLASLYNNRGMVHESAERFNSALEDYNRAILLDSGFAEAMSNRGVVYDHLGKLDLALDDYNRAIGINSYFPESYNNRGMVYVKQMKFELALNDFNKAISLRPDFAEAYNNRGIVYGHRQQYKKAIREFTTALKINPLYENAAQNLALTRHFERNGLSP